MAEKLRLAEPLAALSPLSDVQNQSRVKPAGLLILGMRQVDLPPSIVDLAWRAQLRLHHRYRHLGARIGPHKALTAIARELAGFVWAVGQLLEEVPAAA